MKFERVILDGILCKCEASRNEITFAPEFGKETVFQCKEILAVKSRPAERIRPGRFTIACRDGRSVSIKIMYKENRALKRMLMFLMEYVPGDVTFRKSSAEEEMAGRGKRKMRTKTGMCPKCHSIDIETGPEGKWTKRLMRKEKLVCRRCGYQFI